jgi:hypothetical protein
MMFLVLPVFLGEQCRVLATAFWDVIRRVVLFFKGMLPVWDKFIAA